MELPPNMSMEEAYEAHMRQAAAIQASRGRGGSSSRGYSSASAAAAGVSPRPASAASSVSYRAGSAPPVADVDCAPLPDTATGDANAVRDCDGGSPSASVRPTARRLRLSSFESPPSSPTSARVACGGYTAPSAVTLSPASMCSAASPPLHDAVFPAQVSDVSLASTAGAHADASSKPQRRRRRRSVGPTWRRKPPRPSTTLHRSNDWYRRKMAWARRVQDDVATARRGKQAAEDAEAALVSRTAGTVVRAGAGDRVYWQQLRYRAGVDARVCEQRAARTKELLQECTFRPKVSAAPCSPPRNPPSPRRLRPAVSAVLQLPATAVHATAQRFDARQQRRRSTGSVPPRRGRRSSRTADADTPYVAADGTAVYHRSVQWVAQQSEWQASRAADDAQTFAAAHTFQPKAYTPPPPRPAPTVDSDYNDLIASTLALAHTVLGPAVMGGVVAWDAAGVAAGVAGGSPATDATATAAAAPVSSRAPQGRDLEHSRGGVATGDERHDASLLAALFP